MRSSDSNATPEMIQWTRIRSGYSVRDVARSEGISETTIEEWESGITTPTHAQLERLSIRYKFPMMVFYLESRPSEFNVVKDRRSLPGTAAAPFSPKLVAILRGLQEKQAWISEYLDGETDLEFVDSEEFSSGAVEVGRSLRKLLGVSVQEQSSCSSDNSAWNMWRSRCEQLGIFVFVFSGIEIDECRGVALSSSIAPVAAVNSKDSCQSRTFTLLHECVHILLGDTSASTRARQATDAIERFCEEAAAEAFIPLEDFKKVVPAGWKNRETDIVRSLSRRYWCSKAATYFRLVDAGLLSMDEALAAVAGMKLRMSPGKPKKEMKIPRPTLVLSRNGRSFSSLAVDAFKSGAIHGGQLSTLLDMKLKHLAKFEKMLRPTNGTGT